MTVRTTRALLAALALAVSPLALSIAHGQDRPVNDQGDGNRFQRPAQQKAQAAQSLSSAVQQKLAAAQAAQQAKKIPEALAAAKEGLAAAKTDYEKLTANQILTSISLAAGDEAGAVAAAEAAADTPDASIPAEYKQSIYYAGAALALNAKHYEKAVTYAKALQAMGANDARSQDVIGRVLFASGDPGAIAFIQKQIDASTASGKPPSRDQLQMLLAAQAKAKDEAGAEKTMIQSVLYYNDKQDWKQIIDVSMSTRGIRDIDALMLGRLLFVSGAEVTKDDADLIGQTAQKMAIYGDAQAAQAKGATLQMDAARVAADKADVPNQIGPGASQNGLFNIKLAEALYGYGMYAQ
ncbi:MAG: hypothetical protein JO256_04795, partial [Alphaproteobacteria bacterium]|nr:hypothetical protein [Alphaproteobacteria bacterium]